MCILLLALGSSRSAVQFNSASYAVNESLQFATITVTRTGDTSVNFATSDGTAHAPTDFLISSSNLTFAAGETFKTFSVSVLDDLFVEGNETINLALSSPTGGAYLGSPSKATLTIFDNDVLASSPPQLILDSSGPDANQAAALDSLLLLRDPFRVTSFAEWLDLGSDRNTRVAIFAANLSLSVGETSTAVVVNLIDSNNQSYDVPAEDVRLVPNFEMARISFRLPNNLPAGTYQVRLKLHGLVSNVGVIRIQP